MIDVCIVEDDDELREGLCVLINGTANFSCAGSYRSCEAALKNLDKDLPDVILLDIELPGMSGIQAVALFKKILPDIEIIMMTVHQDNESVFESLQNGASGYLVKNIEPAALLQAIQEVYEGGSPMSMKVARMVTESFRRTPPSHPLSKREQQVLEKLCEGNSYQAIANELFIAKTTVKFHIRNIYKALHVTNKAAAVAKAKDQRML